MRALSLVGKAGQQLDNALKNMKPEDEPIGVLLGALDYYINNDTIQPLPDHLFNKQ